MKRILTSLAFLALPLALFGQFFYVPGGAYFSLTGGTTSAQTLTISGSGTFNGGGFTLTLSGNTTLPATVGTVTQVTGANGIGITNTTSTPALTLPITLAGTGTFTMTTSTTLTGGGTISLGGFTETIPASGTVAVQGLTATFSNGTYSGTLTTTGAATLAGGVTVTGSSTVQTLSTGALTWGASGTALTNLIVFSVSASSGLITVTNAAVTATSVPVGWGITTGAGTIGQYPFFTFHTGSFTAAVTNGDTSTYSLTVGVK